LFGKESATDESQRHRAIFRRSCPRCGGDLYVDILEEKRGEDDELVCLQCGSRTLRSRLAAPEPAVLR